MSAAQLLVHFLKTLWQRWSLYTDFKEENETSFDNIYWDSVPNLKFNLKAGTGLLLLPCGKLNYR